MEAMKPESWGSDSYISSQNTKWLAESLDAVDQNVNQLLQLIEEDGDSCASKAEMFYQKRPELVARVDEFYNQYRLLAERYDHLTKKLCESASQELQLKTIPELDVSPQTCYFTPDHKMGAHKYGHQVVGLGMHLSSPNGSSDLSSKGGSGSSSTLLSESDSEYSNSSTENLSGPFKAGKVRALQQKFTRLETEYPGKDEKLQVGEEDNEINMLMLGVTGNYEELLGRIERYEDELRVVNLKLQFSEKEAARLWCELEKNEGLTENLQAKLELAQSDVQVHEADFVSEKRKVLKLQEKIKGFTNDISNCEKETCELKAALSDSQKKFSLMEALLKSDISSLSEQKNLLEERLGQCEHQVLSLKDEIKELEAEKLKMNISHAQQEKNWRTEINLLKAEHAARGEEVGSLNRSADALKLKYDMLMAEKDEVNAKVQTLSAELSSRDCLIRQLEEHVNHLCTENNEVNARVKTLVEELGSKDNVIQQVKVLLSQLATLHTEVISGADHANSVVDELKLRVTELEEELDRQRVLVSEAAEEKRAAIRQLCFSLEHYRSGYQELCQAFIRQQRPAVF